MRHARGRRADPAGLAIAAALAVIAAVIFWDAASISITATYGVGPHAVPMVIAGGLALLAIGNAVMSLRGDLPPREEADPKAVAFILAGLAVVIVSIGWSGGFIPALAVLFALTARAFGREAFLTDLGIGFALTTIIYLLFDKLLTLSLPAGPLERLL